jgi:hypothetical protein
MLRYRKIFLSLAASALVNFMAIDSHAETISMTLSIGAGPSLVLDIVPGVTPGATSYSVDGSAGPGFYPGTLALGTINSFLAAGGSAYQFTALAGSSNFPGLTQPALMTLSGEIHAVGANGLNMALTLTESESGFLAPSPGTSSTLSSSSTGNFTNQSAGGGHEAFSSVSATPPPNVHDPSVHGPLDGARGEPWRDDRAEKCGRREPHFVHAP